MVPIDPTAPRRPPPARTAAPASPIPAASAAAPTTLPARARLFARKNPQPRPPPSSPPGRRPPTSSRARALPLFPPFADNPPPPDPVNYDNVWLLRVQPVSTIYTAPKADISTAMADIGTPADIVGESWLRRHPPVFTSPLKTATTRHFLGHDVPPFIGNLSLRITTSDTSGRALSCDLLDVHILRHAAVPLLLGFHSHKILNINVDAARSTTLFGRARRPVLCHVQRGHLTLPPPRTSLATPTFYIRSELALAHRQFRHASIEALLRTLPPTKFTPTDVATLREVARFCVPCQQYARLPRRPRHALPPRPLTFNRIIALDPFQPRADLPKVLDITGLHTEFG